MLFLVDELILHMYTAPILGYTGVIPLATFKFWSDERMVCTFFDRFWTVS